MPGSREVWVPLGRDLGLSWPEKSRLRQEGQGVELQNDD